MLQTEDHTSYRKWYYKQQGQSLVSNKGSVSTHLSINTSIHGHRAAGTRENAKPTATITVDEKTFKTIPKTNL
jgi:hypothetical protein